MSERKCRGQTWFWRKIANCISHIVNCKLLMPFKKPRPASKPSSTSIKSPGNSKTAWASGKPLAYLALILVCFSFLASAAAQETSPSNQPLTMKLPDGLSGGPKQWASPEGLSSTIQVMLLLTVLSLAPAVLLMTTCFVRIVVVLSLLRQAIGTDRKSVV
jgi:hypothetical protein